MPTDRIPGTALVLAVALFLTSCGGQTAGTAGQSPDAPAAPPTLPADPQELPDMTPDQFDALLADVSAGTPVVVNFWGSWCGPCKREAATFAELSERYEGAVQFIGVNLLDTKDGARRFMETYGITYPSVFDPSPTGAIRTSYGFTGQPATLFISYGGEESYRWEGEISEDQLDRAIRPLLPSA